MLIEEKMEWAAHVEDWNSVGALADKLCDVTDILDRECGYLRPSNSAMPKGVRRHAAGLFRGAKKWEHYTREMNKACALVQRKTAAPT